MKISSIVYSVFQNRRMFKPFLRNLIISVCLVTPIVSQASLAASDNAGNYTDSWGGNQGSGFEAWEFSYSGEGSRGSYLANANGGSAVNSGNGKAWGIYANSASDSQANAIRPFTGGSLTVGQTLNIQMNNGGVGNSPYGGSVGLSLRDSSHNNIFEFFFHGGDTHYTIGVSGTPIATSIAWTTSALNLSFTQGSGNTWSFSIGSTVYSSDSTGHDLSGANISEIRLFSYGNNNDIFFNNLNITPVPEPITLALPIFVGIFGAVGLHRYLAKRKNLAV